jgi:hypothetical protein
MGEGQVELRGEVGKGRRCSVFEAVGSGQWCRLEAPAVGAKVQANESDASANHYFQRDSNASSRLKVNATLSGYQAISQRAYIRLFHFTAHMLKAP